MTLIQVIYGIVFSKTIRSVTSKFNSSRFVFILELGDILRLTKYKTLN